MQRSLSRPIAAVLVCVLGTAAVFADAIITPVGQLRETEVLAEITGEGNVADSDLDSAPGFGPFASTIDAHVEQGLPPNPITADSDGSQSSDIFATLIQATGAAAAICSPEDAGFVPSSFGRSAFSVTFTLDELTPYMLTGSLFAGESNGGAPLASIELSSTLDGSLYSLSTTSGNAPILSVGLLPAGEYTLLAFAEAEAAPSNRSADASYDFEFNLVPEPTTAALLLLGGLLAGRRRSWAANR